MIYTNLSQIVHTQQQQQQSPMQYKTNLHPTSTSSLSSPMSTTPSNIHHFNPNQTHQFKPYDIQQKNLKSVSIMDDDNDEERIGGDVTPVPSNFASSASSSQENTNTINNSNENETQHKKQKHRKEIRDKERKKKHKKKHSHRHHHHRHGHGQSDNDHNDVVNDIDDDDEEIRQRRSDRIKVIETLRQHHKELEIAEKIKKHSNVQQQTNDHADNEKSSSNYNPVKIKDRWRRWSEKENENDCNQTPPLTASSPSSNSPSFSRGSYKKIILDKLICEQQQQQQVEEQTPFDFSTISDLYEHIDENVFVTKK